jgi:chemotaxis signal transduction protein
MSKTAASLTARAAAMRDAFDRSFAAPRPPEPPPDEDLLAIRIGAEPYALRLSEVAALHADRQIARLPGATAALRGIAGFRGVVVPVYDLAVLLGHPPAETVRWLAMAANEPVAFTFAGIDGRLRVTREATVPSRTGESHQYVSDFARMTDQAMRPVLHLPTIIEAVKRLASPAPPEGH